MRSWRRQIAAVHYKPKKGAYRRRTMARGFKPVGRRDRSALRQPYKRADLVSSSRPREIARLRPADFPLALACRCTEGHVDPLNIDSPSWPGSKALSVEARFRLRGVRAELHALGSWVNSLSLKSGFQENGRALISFAILALEKHYHHNEWSAR